MPSSAVNHKKDSALFIACRNFKSGLTRTDWIGIALACEQKGSHRTGKRRDARSIAEKLDDSLIQLPLANAG